MDCPEIMVVYLHQRITSFCLQLILILPDYTILFVNRSHKSCYSSDCQSVVMQNISYSKHVAKSIVKLAVIRGTRLFDCKFQLNHLLTVSNRPETFFFFSKRYFQNVKDRI